MSYESGVLEGLFALRWGKMPEPEDVDRYARELEVASSRQGKPLVGLFVMPRDSAAPGEEFRKRQAAKLPQIMRHLKFAVAVFEGEGFVSSLKRSALVAILLIAPKKYPIYVRSTVEEALVTDPPGPLDFNAKSAVSLLRQRGLIAPAP